jgi:hypothetical protein
MFDVKSDTIVQDETNKAMFLNPAAIGNAQKVSLSDPKLGIQSTTSLSGLQTSYNNPVIPKFPVPQTDEFLRTLDHMDRYYKYPTRLISVNETEENNYLYKIYESDFDNGTV